LYFIPQGIVKQLQLPDCCLFLSV